MTANQTQIQAHEQTLPQPLLSVVIPVYNSAKYLDRCLRSVLGQSYENLEVILVDDGSSDSSPQLCDTFAQQDARVKVIHQQNRGASAARNAGLDVATGQLIGFLDSDDWLDLDAFSYLHSLMQAHRADIAEAMLESTQDSAHSFEQEPEASFDVAVYEGEEMLIHYLEHNEYAMGMRLYKDTIFTKLRFEEGRMNEDVVAGFMAMLKAQRLVVSNRLIYYYFCNESGVSESPLRKRDFDLLHAGQRLDELTAQTQNSNLRKLALTKKYRAPFTLLVKMTLFGCSEELEQKPTRVQLQKQIRPNYKFLMGSNMPSNRKFMLTLAAFCYPLLAFGGWLYRLAKRR